MVAFYRRRQRFCNPRPGLCMSEQTVIKSISPPKKAKHAETISMVKCVQSLSSVTVMVCDLKKDDTFICRINGRAVTGVVERGYHEVPEFGIYSVLARLDCSGGVLYYVKFPSPDTTVSLVCE